MKAENRWDRRLDVLEVISCGGSAGAESRAALEMFLLQTRPTFVPQPTAGERAPGPHGRGDRQAGGHRYP